MHFIWKKSFCRLWRGININDKTIIQKLLRTFCRLWWGIPVAVQNIDHLYHLSSQIINADGLHLFLFSDGTRIDDNEHLSSLENGTELIVCMEEQIQKLWIYFELKRHLSLKNIFYPLNIDNFLWRFAGLWMAAFSK